MEDHQEFEKPIFELYNRKARSSRKKKKTRLVESMNHHHYEEIFCYYGLRESPKRRTTTQKSLRIKKRLIRCGECGKGFRYEKCLRNHTQTMHSLEEKKKKKKDSMRKDLLCIFGSGVQRRKRSKRVSRYKKILPPPSVSSSSSASSSTFAKDGELLQVAESLIMLSKSGHALFSNQRECEDEQKLVGKLTDGSLSNRRSKDELGQKQKQVGAESFGEQVRLDRKSLDEMLKKAESDTGQKLGGQEAVFEASNGAASKGNIEHRCRVCERVFSTYQALGGHQTVHRMKNNSEKSKHEMQRRVSSRS